MRTAHLLLVEALHVRRPARALAREAVDELGRGDEPPLHEVRLLLQILLLGALLLEALVQRLELRVEPHDVLLRLGQVFRRNAQRLFGLGDLLALGFDGLGDRVVVHHGGYPLEEPGAGARDAEQALVAEPAVFEVGLHLAHLHRARPIATAAELVRAAASSACNREHCGECRSPNEGCGALACR